MRIIGKSFFYVIVVISVLLTVLSLLSLTYDLPYWYSKVLDFPRFQYLVIGLVCLLIFVLINKTWGFASVFLTLGLVTTITIQATKIFPYLWGEKSVPDASVSTVNQENSVGILIANVLVTNRQIKDFLQIVADADPDMLLVMEVDEWWVNQLQVLKNDYPFVMEYPLNNAYGMALYSRLSLKNPAVKFLKHDDVPSFQTRAELPSGKEFMFYGVHPVAPVPSKKYPDNKGEEEVALLKTGKLVAADSLPSIVAGDFNDVSWSKTARLFGKSGNLQNVRIGRGLFNTYNVKSHVLRWPLDHYFATSEFALLELERLPPFGSDHFPMFARLVLENSK